MNFYMLLVEQKSESEEPSIANHITYGDGVSGAMLPVYTSPESLLVAMKACASEKYDYIGFDLTDPFELAEMIESFEAHGLKALLFDPLPAPDGKVRILGDSIPVGDYRRAIEKIHPQFEKLDAEAKTRFCQGSHLAKEPFVRWPAARAEDIAADLRARLEELIACDDN